MDRAGAAIVKRSLTIAGHRTSASLEPPFWAALTRIGAARGMSLPTLVAEVDAGRGRCNLSSALRVYILNWEISRPRPETSPTAPAA